MDKALEQRVEELEKKVAALKEQVPAQHTEKILSDIVSRLQAALTGLQS